MVKQTSERLGTPLYVIIGTRGQFTKTAPVMQHLDKRGIPYTLINTGQHTVSSQEIARIFDVRSADVYLTQRRIDIEKPLEAAQWFLQALISLVLRRKRFFSRGRGLVVIHGDTLSTLLALIGGRLCGMKVAHIESGLRSHSFLHPFPEEIIRIVACRFSHVLFAPSDEAAANLTGYRAVSFNTKGNTVFDAVHFVAGLTPVVPLPPEPYCVATIHRSEVIFNDELFRVAINAVYGAADTMKVIFVVHKATMARLRKNGQIARLENNPNITIAGYYNYPSFMALVKSAQYVMTDGGGLQEETYYLNVPCLILRKRTERNDGLGETALLSELKPEKISYFLEHYKGFKRDRFENKYPSQCIAETIGRLVTCDSHSL